MRKWRWGGNGDTGGARQGALVLATAVILGIALAGCGDGGNSPTEPGTGDFTLSAKYGYVRSYSEGGGIFLVSLVPGDGFSGSVTLTLDADPVLNARLDRGTLSTTAPVAEVTVRPGASVAMRTYPIEVIATRGADVRKVTLQVETFPWGTGSLEEALPKRDALLDWIEEEHPELGSFAGQSWYAYMTYPEIIIVEHWTFLSDEWEVRIAIHVMAPPDDWTMIAIRKRGELDFKLAARRDSDGTPYPIPLSEYPTFFGY